MKRVILTIVLRKVARELGWSLLILALLSAAFSAVIIVPSVGSSLGSGLADYANTVGTYIVVSPIGSPSATLPNDVVVNISAIKGVEAVYPLSVNATFFVAPGGNISSVQNREALSVVVGGGGFPIQLLSLATGKLPNDTGEYALNTQAPSNGPVGSVTEAFVACYSCGSQEPLGSPFSAKEVGTVATDPYLSDIQVFWNATFIGNLLGTATFQETFGSGSTNYVVIKVESLSEMQAVQTALTSILQAYPSFQSKYDQSLQMTLQSFTTSVGPAYTLFSIVAVGLVVAVATILAQIISRRRRWEVGLLAVQGWTRNEIFAVYGFYFLLLSFLSVGVASAVSSVAIQRVSATYSQYGGTFTVVSRLDLSFVIAALAVAAAISALSSYMMARSSRGKALDRTFRDL